ncbi:MAG: Fe-S cluster assembly ATPase SufC [Deltaproteobacteria bacterium]|nr:Fe-S cluster assembly ATPase SufC [Deltaproteobacteria bacterium]
MNATVHTPYFVIEDLHVEVEGKPILKGIDLTINKGEVHALMGRNGAGKSSLTHTLMGHPKYLITRGRVLLNGEDLAGLSPDARAKKGLFLAFQYPTPIPGVTVVNFLRAAMKAVRGGEVPIKEFRKTLEEQMSALKLERAFASRYVNDGFSGGEKKQLEILQLKMLQPTLCLLDETDSGLDIDALKIVAGGVQHFMNPNVAVLLVTHYQRILDYITPHFVHVMIDGQIVQSGGPELAHQLEARGYDWLTKGTADHTAALRAQGG